MVATHLLHFHFRGASPTVVAAEATMGWAQGAWYGAYYGGGANTSVVLDSATYGWAQGAWYGPYYGPGITGEITPVSSGGGKQFYKYERAEDERLRLILAEDAEILEITAILIAKGIL